MFAQNTGWLLRETGERQEKVSLELYRQYAERRVELIQELQAKGVTELDRAIEAVQRLLDRIPFIAFAKDRGLLPDRNLLNRTAFVRVAGLTGWQAFQLLFRSIDKGDPLNGIPKCNGTTFRRNTVRRRNWRSEKLPSLNTWIRYLSQYGGERGLFPLRRTVLRLGANKRDDLTCRGKMTSLRGRGLPGPFNLPRELRLSRMALRQR